MATKLTSLKAAVSAMSSLTGISEERINKFVTATSTNTESTDTISDTLVGNIVKINSNEYLYVRSVNTARHGLVCLNGSVVRYEKEPNGFSIGFNTEHTFYAREEQLANGRINILSDEEFKTSIEGSLIPADVLLSYLSGSAYTPETLEEVVEETPVEESVLEEVKEEVVDEVKDSEETVAVTSELVKKESATEVVELSPAKSDDVVTE
jgi:hypothetical protein